MPNRSFAKKCGNCRQKTMALAVVSYPVEMQHDGSLYSFVIPALEVPKCTNCGEISLDAEADQQIDSAFRREAKLLTPEEIYEGRVRVGYTNQQEFAACFGVSASTISRWENGSQIQQHAHDGWLRVFFKSAEVRRLLADLHGLPSNNSQEVLASSVRSI